MHLNASECIRMHLNASNIRLNGVLQLSFQVAVSWYRDAFVYLELFSPWYSQNRSRTENLFVLNNCRVRLRHLSCSERQAWWSLCLCYIVQSPSIKMEDLEEISKNCCKIINFSKSKFHLMWFGLKCMQIFSLKSSSNGISF